MKATTLFWLMAMFGSAALAQAAEPALPADAAPLPKAEVTWNPDASSYRDIEVYGDTAEDSLETVQDALNPVFERLAKQYLSDGQRLKVQVADLDLAGEIEFWRTRTHQDVRVIRSIYPPRIKFSWQVVDVAGEVVREGSEDLRDTNFEWRMRPAGMRRMFDIEEDMLSDWGRSALRNG